MTRIPLIAIKTLDGGISTDEFPHSLLLEEGSQIYGFTILKRTFRTKTLPSGEEVPELLLICDKN
jgi:hypothetical protein